ncbi:MAG: HAD-IA family hydrolase [Candidatus Kapaibacterium sp.]
MISAGCISGIDVIPSLLIIDLGGVLFDIDFEKTRTAMMQLEGYNGAPISFGVEQQDDVFVAYDRGDISTAEFRLALRGRYGFSCSDMDIDRAWCAILERGLFPFAQDEVRRLKATYAAAPGSTTVILSNISELHYLDCEERCRPVFEMVDRVYLSYAIRRRKPDPVAFLHVIEAEGFAPSQAILVDDSRANCDSAATLGLRIEHLIR